MSDKIHRRVAEVLGMALDSEDESLDMEILEGEVPEEAALVPVPTDVEEQVDNPELPCLKEELIRIEHGQRQTEMLVEKGISVVVNVLEKLPFMPLQYQPRAMETASELYRAVADLIKHKEEYQIKLIDSKMKQAAFTRNKTTANPLGTNNTFVIGREELIRMHEQRNKNE